MVHLFKLVPFFRFRYFIAILFFIIFLAPTLFAQKEAALLLQLDSAFDATSKASIYNKLSYLNRRNNTEKAIEYGEKALEFSQIAKDKVAEIFAIQNIAYPYYRQGKYDLALQYFEDALKRATVIEDTTAMIRSLSYMGTTHNYKANFEKGLDYLEQALQLSRASNDLYNVSAVLNRKASIYRKQGDFKNGLQSYKEALAIDILQKDTLGEAETRHNMAIILIHQGHFRPALEEFQKTLRIKEIDKDSAELASGLGSIGNAYQSLGIYDSAFISFQKAVTYARHFRTPTLECFNLRNIANLLITIGGDLEEAMQYAKNALVIANRMNTDNDIAICLSLIGRLYTYQDSLEQAQYYLEAALQKTNNDNKWHSVSIYNRLGKVYFEKGNFERAKTYHQAALELSKVLKSKKDESISIYYLAKIESQANRPHQAIIAAEHSLEIAKRINFSTFYDALYKILVKNHEITRNYKEAFQYQILLKNNADSLLNSEKQKELAKLEIQFKTKEKELENKVLKSNQAKNKALLQRRKVLGIALGLGLITVILLAIIYTQMAKAKARHKIRQQLTRDIHDDIGSILNNLKVTAKNVLEKQTQSTENQKDLKQIVHYGNQALISMKNLIWGLEDTDKKYFTQFLNTVQTYADNSLNPAKINYKFQIDSFPKDLMLASKKYHHLFMIYKEAIQNIIKHAPNSDVEIILKNKADHFLMEITNTFSKTIKERGFGLKNMQQRATFIKGKIKFIQEQNHNKVILKVNT